MVYRSRKFSIDTLFLGGSARASFLSLLTRESSACLPTLIDLLAQPQFDTMIDVYNKNVTYRHVLAPSSARVSPGYMYSIDEVIAHHYIASLFHAVGVNMLVIGAHYRLLYTAARVIVSFLDDMLTQSCHHVFGYKPSGVGSSYPRLIRVLTLFCSGGQPPQDVGPSSKSAPVC